MRLSSKNITRAITTVVAGAMLFSFASPTLADQYSDQINQLNQQIQQQKSQLSTLAGQADTLSNQIASINAQIASVEAQIAEAQLKYNQVTAQLQANQQQLAAQKQVLDDNLRLIYQENQITPIEVLASSGSLSDFFDRQEYLSSIKDKVQSAMDTINKLNQELATEQQQQSGIIAQQQSLEQGLAVQRADLNNLLAETQGQEAAYQNLVNQTNQKLQAVVAARAAAIRDGQLRVSSGGCGGYPSIWCNAPQDSAVDNWDFYNRECVSYVAWKRWSLGLSPQPDAWGNAADWERFVDHRSNPQRGDIAVWGPYANAYIGGYGHVAFVESADGGGITISQYNFNVGNGDGLYSEMYVPYGSTMWGGIGFIH